MPDGIPSPNPQFPQPIKNVTGSANVKIQNKNLASLRTDLSCYGGTVTDTVIINNDTGKVISTLIPIKSNTTYTLYKEKSTPISSSRFFYYDREPIINETTSIGGNYLPAETNYVLQFTTPATAKWLYVRWSNDNDTNPCGNVQILEGAYTSETISSYVPHQEQNYPFTFANGQRLMQGGELQDGGIYNTRKQKRILRWGNGFGGVSYVSDGVFFVEFNDYNGILGACSHFTNAENSQITNNDKAVSMLNNGEFNFRAGTFDRIYFKDTNITSQEDAIQLLEDNQIILEYQVQTPETIAYNSTQASQYEAIKNARSYDDMTIISSKSDELPPLLEIQYWKERGAE